MVGAEYSSARVTWMEDGTPFAPEYGDIYCSREGAGQAAVVFVDGCDLRSAWRRGEPVTVLETGFGLGLNCAATLRAFAEERAQESGASLRYVAIELYPALVADAARAHGIGDGPKDEIAEALVENLPELYADGSTTVFCSGTEVSVELTIGDGADALRRLASPVDALAVDAHAADAHTVDAHTVDALFLDGFAPDRNPDLWSPAVFTELARLAKPGARLATYTVARPVRDGLEAAGFDVEIRTGAAPKRHRLVGVRRGGLLADGRG